MKKWRIMKKKLNRHYEDYSDEDVKKLVESWYMVNDRLKSISNQGISDNKKLRW